MQTATAAVNLTTNKQPATTSLFGTKMPKAGAGVVLVRKKMSLAAEETCRLLSWLGLTAWSSAALRGGKFCHALVSSRFQVAVARVVSSGDQYNPLEQ